MASSTPRPRRRRPWPARIGERVHAERGEGKGHACIPAHQIPSTVPDPAPAGPGDVGRQGTRRPHEIVVAERGASLLRGVGDPYPAAVQRDIVRYVSQRVPQGGARDVRRGRVLGHRGETRERPSDAGRTLVKVRSGARLDHHGLIARLVDVVAQPGDAVVIADRRGHEPLPEFGGRPQ